MRNIKILILLIASLNLWGCMKDLRMDKFSDDSISSTITVSVSMPQGYNYSTAGLTVKLNDPSTGLAFSGLTDQNGVATIKVAHGSYIATTETKHSTGKLIYIFNGTSNKIRVNPSDAKTVSSALPLNVSKSGQLIIKEIYYGGVTNPADGKSYTSKDTYFIIYNNSEDVAYLDSLCVGVSDPWLALTSGRTSPWVKTGTTELRDSVPNSLIGWMFPGNGTNHPVAPGGEVVVCLNGINHKTVCSTSVDLSTSGNWALYNQIMTPGQTSPQPGVNRLEAFWKCGTATAYIIAPQGPGLFIYTLGGKTSSQFVADTYTWKPGQSSRNFDCLMVDKNLVVDGVECLRNVTDTKRFRSEIDNGFIKVDGTGTGQAVHRKIDEAATTAAGGIIVYMDTNNSSIDEAATLAATKVAGGRIVYVDSNNSSNDFEKRNSASLLNK